MPSATFRQSQDGPLLTMAQAAERLQVSKRTLERLIAEGELPAIRIGPTLVRIDLGDLDDFKRGRKRAG